jgi:hypothetical protein
VLLLAIVRDDQCRTVGFTFPITVPVRVNKSGPMFVMTNGS